MLKKPDLPDPDACPDADVVIFDGQCVFCRSQVERLHWLDRGNRLSFLSLHDPRVSDRYPDLHHDDLMAQMYVIDGRGNAKGGSEAVKYLSRRLPILWPALPVLHFPGTATLWRWLYKQVAKRRYRLAEKPCDEDQCRIHID